ncbi:LysM peptidoglycan-binding domain-containing protein [Bacillus sp. 03113]|uniref:cell division suppressor protein YneA n=1 Tax=Bacillus sp. 03113 TaxID=2578211 RepID=UPI001145158E|nr:LysM peptidoglycan-binding domain-containing protein [Bacillus sp. 03113]
MQNIWKNNSYTIILILLSIVITFVLMTTMKQHDNQKYVTITVEDGDSLWEISNKYSKQHNLSNEQFINWVVKHNEVASDRIYPGEEIIIPVKDKLFSDDEVTNLASN